MNHPQSPWHGPQHICLPDLGPKSRLARPLGLGSKFRLARPPRARTQTLCPTPSASDANSVSPDPSRARAPTPLYPVRTRLPTHGARTTTWQAQWLPYRSRAWWRLFQPPWSLCSLPSFTVQPYLFHCGAPPHSKRGMGEVNQHHYLLSSLTVNMTGCSIADPTPTTPTGLGNLHRSIHAVSHTSRTGWASLCRVGTVDPPLGRENLQSLM